MQNNDLLQSDYVTKSELAAMLRVTPRTITNYVSGGALPAPTKVGRKALWNRELLRTFLQAQAAQGTRDQPGVAAQ